MAQDTRGRGSCCHWAPVQEKHVLQNIFDLVMYVNARYKKVKNAEERKTNVICCPTAQRSHSQAVRPFLLVSLY